MLGDTQGLVNFVSKFQVPSSYGLRVKVFWGPTQIQKFWGSFFGPSFGHYGGKRGGLNLFQKFWGSFEVVFRYFLGCFEVVFGGMFFPKSA